MSKKSPLRWISEMKDFFLIAPAPMSASHLLESKAPSSVDKEKTWGGLHRSGMIFTDLG